jgi:hypothetical protein
MKRVRPEHYQVAREMRFVFPMPPNLANGRMHWRVKHKAKTDYWRILDFGQRLFPRLPDKPFEKATISVVLRLGHAMDDDNAMARVKWALDWLVTRGYIVDDKRKNLKWEGLPEQIVKRDGCYRLEITLREVGAKE